jgi:hypothetical protein
LRIVRKAFAPIAADGGYVVDDLDRKRRNTSVPHCRPITFGAIACALVVLAGPMTKTILR